MQRQKELTKQGSIGIELNLPVFCRRPFSGVVVDVRARKVDSVRLARGELVCHRSLGAVEAFTCRLDISAVLLYAGPARVLTKVVI